jgi:hypothetical protein
MTKCQGESYRRGLAGEYLREALSSTIILIVFGHGDIRMGSKVGEKKPIRK